MAVNKSRKRIIFFIFLFAIISLLIFFNIDIYKERKEIRSYFLDAKQELDVLKKEMEIVKQREEEMNIDEEIERIAREQLLLKKEGERVFIIKREDEEVLVEEVEEEPEEEEGFFKGLFNSSD
jgi:cell division protein FtsB